MVILNNNNTLQDCWNNSAFSGSNAGYLETLFENFLIEPSSISAEWRDFFEAMDYSNPDKTELEKKQTSHQKIRAEFKNYFKSGKSKSANNSIKKNYTINFNLLNEQKQNNADQIRVLQFINAYRFLGHQIANTDPLYENSKQVVEELTLEYYHFTEATLDLEFQTGSLCAPDTLSLRAIIDLLKKTYSGSLGAEYMHLSNIQEKRWIQNYLESGFSQQQVSTHSKIKILKHLISAEGLEQYLHTKYVGQKRFSLEGSESLIPLLKELIERAGAKHDIEEMAIGMAHRGRINVLINIMGKIPSELFLEFEGKSHNHTGTGDVKYHLGYSADLKTDKGPVHVALAFNPSHLEIIAPVVEGSVRARQDRRHDKRGKSVIPIVIHGDAAFAGQGVVMETFNMSQSRGYSTKGTIHIVVNNQIGFTTSKQEDARSSLYCTDVAKMVNAPILHVNGDDPEAVIFSTQLALDYRMCFSKDIVIDLVCYRRHGHSEADEPMVTQPMMYKCIREKDSSLMLYAQQLIQAGVINSQQYSELKSNYRELLLKGESLVSEITVDQENLYPYLADWSQFKNCDSNFIFDTNMSTQVDRTSLYYCYTKITNLPAGFKLHRNVAKVLASRDKMSRAEQAIDWGFAETMAYATLLNDGYSIRLSGQDSGRGTFFHRHAILHNQNDTSVHIPLRNLNTKDVTFLVSNSLLSEEAVLAFEYGYATTDPMTMVIWEAQFGDFSNNAQVVIDQFISAGEQKWNRLCGLVMLLPHGFEGQGPEHSSARLERYLQLCAQHNMQVCIPSTAAQIFHLLRRQMLMKCRRPLIVMSPKSLLRLPAAMSHLDDLSNGFFQTVIPNTNSENPELITRIIFCSGRIYYSLYDALISQNRVDVAILRVEQLYPFPSKSLSAEIRHYPNARIFVWCQEEPMNQGAWYSSQHHIRHVIGKSQDLHYAGRPSLAAPAVGNLNIHKTQEKELITQALGDLYG